MGNRKQAGGRRMFHHFTRVVLSLLLPGFLLGEAPAVP